MSGKMSVSFKGVLVSAGLVTFLSFGGAASADDGTQHRLEYSPPIVLGTSGGNINDFGTDGTYVYCCGGTLGALVTDGTYEYILSNNHVLARVNLEPVPSFTFSHDHLNIVYVDTEDIIHPGLIDQGKIDPDGTANSVCKQDTDDTVANLNLTDFVQIFFDDEDEVNNSPVNRVDAAIAQVVSGAVSAEILDIGWLSSATVAPQVRMAVKKSGRTTGLTAKKIRAFDVTANVGYTDECGGEVVRTAYFENQILVWGSGFSAGGDSGSLVVEDVATNPRAVGLLFAGSLISTLVNPIDTVLDELSAEHGSSLSMVGASGGPTPPPPEEEDGGGPPPGRGGGKFLSGDVPFGLEVASAVKSRHEDRLFDIPGVVGTGISVDDAGNPVIEIYIERATRAAGRPIPQALEGVPVRVVETGRFIAY